MDHTDAEPTLMALVGLKSDYTPDGRVLTEVMANPPSDTQSPTFLPLAQCYKQMNSSVGQFGSDTLAADTQAVESGSGADDSQYQSFSGNLASLGSQRDALATTIKNELYNAEFNATPLPGSAADDLAQCNTIVASAAALVSNPGTGTPESPLVLLLPIVGIALVEPSSSFAGEVGPPQGRLKGTGAASMAPGAVSPAPAPRLPPSRLNRPRAPAACHSAPPAPCHSAAAAPRTARRGPH